MKSARITCPARSTSSVEHLIIATGSDAVPVWTNREPTTLVEIPNRTVSIGGSAVGVVLALFLKRFGDQVTILDRYVRLLSREDPRPGELTEILPVGPAERPADGSASRQLGRMRSP